MMEPASQLSEADALYRAGRWAEAKAVCDLILAREPSNVGALQLAGSLALQDGDPEAAAGYFSRAVTAEPGNAIALYNLGNALVSLRRYAEAEARYGEALARKPNSAPIHANRGVALAALNRVEDAIASFDKAIALKPDFFEPLKNRGGALHAAGRLEEAVASYDRAAAANPGDAMTLAQRGSALLAAKRYGAAAESYSAALALQPDYGFRLLRLYARMGACDWQDFDEEAGALAVVPSHGLNRAPPYPLMAMTDSPAALYDAAVGYAREKNPENPVLGPLPRRRRPEKIRVGYFSPDFRDHPVLHLLVEALECHDRDRFEVVALSYGPTRDDDIGVRLRKACDIFLDVREASDQSGAARARDLAIDVAVDLSGYTASSRPGIFALRAAPVQVSYLGYPGTLGAPFMDYLIADRVVIPDQARAFYQEKIVTLPHCYMPGDRKRPTATTAPLRETYGLPKSGMVFCGFHNSFKISPRIFDCWMNILHAVDGSVLWLRFDGDEAAANLRREANRRGIDEKRLVFAHHVPMAEHMARHRLADLFLDTYPYNAHSTTNDALWMGLPVVTLMGQSYAARVAASLLTTAGLPELITHSHAQYQALAIALAGDAATRAQLGKRLAAARGGALFDTPGLTRHLEAAFRLMMQRHDAGLAPDHIHVMS